MLTGCQLDICLLINKDAPLRRSSNYHHPTQQTLDIASQAHQTDNRLALGLHGSERMAEH